MDSTPQLSVVIPFFDEEDNLPILVDEIDEVLRQDGGTFEVIYVDDGSRDGSVEVLRRAIHAKTGHRLVRLKSNRGQSAAMALGFHKARGRVVVTLDADLQNDPRDIPQLVAELERQGVDVVSGVRQKRRDTWVRRISSRIANRVRDAILHDGVSDVGCSLKAYRGELLRHVPAFNGMHRFLPALLKMQDARIVEMPVNHRPRRHGESKYGIGNRLWRGLADLAAVRWMQQRWVDPRWIETAEEDDRASAAGAGEDFEQPVA